MNNEEYMKRQKWENIRRKGLFQFILVTGVLRIAVPLSIISSCYYYFSINEWTLTDFMWSTFLVEYLIWIFFSYCFLGIMLTIVSWYVHLDKFKE
jgi:hypothetical protein